MVFGLFSLRRQTEIVFLQKTDFQFPIYWHNRANSLTFIEDPQRPNSGLLVAAARRIIPFPHILMYETSSIFQRNDPFRPGYEHSLLYQVKSLSSHIFYELEIKSDQRI